MSECRYDINDFDKVAVESEDSCNGCFFYENTPWVECPDDSLTVGCFSKWIFKKKKYRTEVEGKFICKAVEQDTTQWYKKRYPKIKDIHSNQEKGVAVVILKDGRKGVVKVQEGDDWNLEVGILSAYVKAMDGFHHGGVVINNKDICNDGIVDMTDIITSAEKINIKTCDIIYSSCMGEVLVGGKKYYVSENWVSNDCGITSIDVTLNRMR